MTFWKKIELPIVTVIVVVISALYILGPHLETMNNDPGLGWHLKAGEIILNTGAFIYEEPFLALSDGQRWVYDQWLSGLLLSSIFEIGSWELLVVFSFSLILLTFFPFVWARTLQDSNSAIWSGLSILLSLKLLTLHAITRPLVFSFLLFAILLCLLYRFRQQLLAGSLSSGLSFAIPFLFIAWVNIHPYFAMGLVIFGLVLFGMMLDQVVLTRFKVPPKSWKMASLVFLLSIAVTLVNPYGYAVHLQTIAQGLDPFFSVLYSEWRPLDFTSPEGELFQFVIGIIALAAIFSEDFRKRYGFAELLPALALIHFALGSVRGVPLVGIFIAPLLACAFKDLAGLPWFSRFPFLRRKGGCRVIIQPGVSSVVMPIFCGLVLGYVVFSDRSTNMAEAAFEPSRELYPYEALSTLREWGRDEPITIYSSPNLGGFLIFNGYPEIKPMLDDRNTVNSQEAYQDYLDLLDGTKELCEVELARESSVVLVSSRSVAGRGREDLTNLGKVDLGSWILVRSVAKGCISD